MVNYEFFEIFFQANIPSSPILFLQEKELGNLKKLHRESFPMKGYYPLYEGEWNRKLPILWYFFCDFHFLIC